MGSGPYLERMQPFDVASGYNINRIVDALTANRSSATVAIMEPIILSVLTTLTGGSPFTWSVIIPPVQTDTILKTYIHFTSPSGSGITLAIDGTDRTVALGGPWGSGNITGIDASSFITTTGWHTLAFQSSAGTPFQAYFQIQSLFNSAI